VPADLVTPKVVANGFEGSPDDGDDRLLGGAGFDVLLAGGGSDVLDGGDAADYLDAGAGNDFDVHDGFGDDVVRGGSGDDTVRGDDGIDQIFGNDGSDKIFGDSATSTIGGNTKNFMIYQRLFGGAGSDEIYAYVPANNRNANDVSVTVGTFRSVGSADVLLTTARAEYGRFMTGETQRVAGFLYAGKDIANNGQLNHAGARRSDPMLLDPDISGTIFVDKNVNAELPVSVIPRGAGNGLDAFIVGGFTADQATRDGGASLIAEWEPLSGTNMEGLRSNLIVTIGSDTVGKRRFDFLSLDPNQGTDALVKRIKEDIDADSQLHSLKVFNNNGKLAFNAYGSQVSVQEVPSSTALSAGTAPRGQYVRISLPGNDRYLSLVEVEVFSSRLAA